MMASSASSSLEPCDDGRGYQFRSLEELHTLLEIAPPYQTCVAYAPFARHTPSCSRPVNRQKAASVADLLDRLLRVRIPSSTAEFLLKILSTHAVCGITGWHQNKAAEVHSKWRHKFWKDYLRVHGLDPRLWKTPAPPMAQMRWESGLEVARWEQGYDLEDDDDDYDEDDGEGEEKEDSDSDDSESLSGESVGNSDATPSDLDEGGDDFDFGDSESSSGESVAIPDTTSFDFDQSSSEETVITPDTTTSDFDQSSSDGYLPVSSQHVPKIGAFPEPLNSPTDSQRPSSGDSTPAMPASTHQPDINTGEVTATLEKSEEESEGGTPDEDSFTADLLALSSEIFRDSDVTSDSSLSSDLPAPISQPHPGFRVYAQAPSSASQLMQLLNLMTQTVSHRRRYTGFIYGYVRPSLPGFLKIGVVKNAIVQRRPFPDPVDHRLATWQAQCGHPVTEVFRKRIVCAAAERIESLVHLALREYRRVEDPPCGRCERRKKMARAKNGGRRSGGKHDEWFEVETHTAMRVVDLWVAFAGQLPYDRFGRLADFWSDKVEDKKRHVGPGDTVQGWLEMMPRLAEECTRAELDNIIGRFCILT